MSAPNRILAVDDDPVSLKLLEVSLGKAGLEIFTATSGKQAIEVAREELPDLILMDVGMPEMDGFSACEILKSHVETAQIPVIFITGKTRSQDIERAFSIGGSDYIAKPFHVSEVKARISVHLRLMRAQLDLEESNAQLLRGQKLESIGQLAAGVAHEINTPTQYVSDNAHFLQESFAELVELLDGIRSKVGEASARGEESETLDAIAKVVAESDLEYLLAEVPKSLEQSIDGLGRIATIVRAMKEFSHPGSKEMEPSDLHHAIESTITVAGNEWKYVAEMVKDFDPHMPLVHCSIGDLNQVILNLIVNAAQAIEDQNGDGAEGKGTISISTRLVEEMAEIRVSDTGAGIPEDIRNRVFDPFFTTKSVGRGTGQGLALAHTIIVDQHGGFIAVESESGKGSTFTIQIPTKVKQFGAAA